MGPCVSYASKYSGNRPRVRWRGLHCTCRKTYDCRGVPKRKLLSAVRGGVGHVRLDFVANSESILVCKERMCL